MKNFPRLFLALMVLSLFSAVPVDVLAASEDPITIGLIAAQTGPFEYEGRVLIHGVELALAEASYTIGGRPIKLITEDTGGSPDLALTKTQKLVERDGVDILVGPVSSAVALALRNYVVEHEVPWVVPLAMPEMLTRPPMASKYIFRVQVVPSQANVPFGKWLYENKGYRRMVAMGMDFPAGRDSVEAFKRGFEEAGGEIVQEMFTPLNNPDFGPYLSRIDRSVDAVYAWYAGADAIKFDSQYFDYGLKDQIPLTGFTGITEGVILESVKDFVDGVVTVTPYTPTLDLPENRRFVAAYRQRYGENPALPSANGYIAAQVILDALRRVEGNLSDKDRFLEAVRATNIDSPRGPIAFDERGQVIATVFIALARNEGGQMSNVVIDTIGGIRQAAD